MAPLPPEEVARKAITMSKEICETLNLTSKQEIWVEIVMSKILQAVNDGEGVPNIFEYENKVPPGDDNEIDLIIIMEDYIRQLATEDGSRDAAPSHDEQLAEARRGKARDDNINKAIESPFDNEQFAEDEEENFKQACKESLTANPNNSVASSSSNDPQDLKMLKKDGAVTVNSNKGIIMPFSWNNPQRRSLAEIWKRPNIYEPTELSEEDKRILAYNRWEFKGLGVLNRLPPPFTPTNTSTNKSGAKFNPTTFSKKFGPSRGGRAVRDQIADGTRDQNKRRYIKKDAMAKGLSEEIANDLATRSVTLTGAIAKKVWEQERAASGPASTNSPLAVPGPAASVNAPVVVSGPALANSTNNSESRTRLALGSRPFTSTANPAARPSALAADSRTWLASASRPSRSTANPATQSSISTATRAAITSTLARPAPNGDELAKEDDETDKAAKDTTDRNN